MTRVTALPEVMKRAAAAYQHGRLAEADDLARAILSVKADYFDALHLLAVISTQQRRFDEALASYDRALALQPDHVEALCNRGIVLHELQQLDEALASYDRALALRPDYAAALYNRGNTLQQKQRLDEALASYDRALALQPDYAQAHFNRSLLQLLKGNFDAGWREYEWRWTDASLKLPNRDFAQPLWLGDTAIEGKTILLHSEQALGDTIQFCRYVPLVAGRGARVLLEVPAPLKDLTASLVGVAQVISAPDQPAYFDLHCPLLSLPLAFGTTIESIPADVPYLTAPSESLRRWNVMLGSKRRLRIGLAWSGQPRPANRSIELRSLLPVLDLDADFVSLQKNVRADDATVLQERSDLVPLGDKLDTFADTAAVIANLDLVISVDTSVAHLAGALAKPVWVLLPFLPDFRWLLDREDSPWYPTARLFRQNAPGDWSGVISRVVVELEKLLQAYNERASAARVTTLPEVMKRAVAAYEAGRLREADDLARAILGVKPDYFDALHLIAVISTRQRRLDEALASYDSALALRPDHAEALCNRGATLYALQRFDEALASYDSALALQPNHAEVLCNRGNTLYELQRFDEALASYDRTLAVQPHHAVALYNRGNTLHELKRFDEALASYDRALALRPDHAVALCNRGATLHELKRFDEALASYDRGLALRPDYAGAFFNRGNTLRQLKRFDEALASYDRALALRPDHVEALCNRGNTLRQLKRFDEALASYDRALALRPDYAEALYNRGITLDELKRFDAALASYDRALAVRPDYAGALNNRGNTLRQLKRLDEALASYDRALAVQPDYAEALYNRGITLHEFERFDEALASYDHALALQPDHAEALNNRGNTLHELKRFDEALASYERALALRPDHVEALINRGVVLHELQRLDEALASYDRALAVRPDHAQAHFSKSVLQLVNGDFDAGWREYEWRWKTEGLEALKRDFAQPLWLGQTALAGKTILLHSEQGFGDAIQFCRYAPLLAGRGARVLLEVPAPLKDLMASLAGVAQVIAAPEQVPCFDLHCPLLSLPLAFRTSLETIPAQTPYLFGAAAKTRAWRTRLGAPNKPRVGLVWAGDPRKQLPNAHRIDRMRSVEFDQLASILRIAGCEFYSLQKGEHALAQLRNSALRQRVVDCADDLHDFSDTAALIDNLDLVIAVDTSVAHLAGALGKPFWLLNRYSTCWRWLIGRDDSPWYPTARLFRQSAPGDWSGVISRVVAELEKLLQARAERGPA
jgi:tetratricopeptide (TPR) repeat protein